MQSYFLENHDWYSTISGSDHRIIQTMETRFQLYDQAAPQPLHLVRMKNSMQALLRYDQEAGNKAFGIP